MYLGGVRGAILYYCLNLKWQLVEHVSLGLKRPFWKLSRLICKNDKTLRKAGVLACRFDTP